MKQTVAAPEWTILFLLVFLQVSPIMAYNVNSYTRWEKDPICFSVTQTFYSKCCFHYLFATSNNFTYEGIVIKITTVRPILDCFGQILLIHWWIWSSLISFLRMEDCGILDAGLYLRVKRRDVSKALFSNWGGDILFIHCIDFSAVPGPLSVFNY